MENAPGYHGPLHQPRPPIAPSSHGKQPCFRSYWPYPHQSNDSRLAEQKICPFPIVSQQPTMSFTPRTIRICSVFHVLQLGPNVPTRTTCIATYRRHRVRIPHRPHHRFEVQSNSVRLIAIPPRQAGRVSYFQQTFGLNTCRRLR